MWCGGCLLILGFGYMDYTFDFSWLGEYLPMIWQGALITLALTLASALIGGLLGTLGAVGMRYGGKALRGVQAPGSGQALTALLAHVRRRAA